MSVHFQINDVQKMIFIIKNKFSINTKKNILQWRIILNRKGIKKKYLRDVAFKNLIFLFYSKCILRFAVKKKRKSQQEITPLHCFIIR